MNQVKNSVARAIMAQIAGCPVSYSMANLSYTDGSSGNGSRLFSAFIYFDHMHLAKQECLSS